VEYVDFLGRWYNLVFLVSGAFGVLAWFVGRRRSPRSRLLAGTLVAGAVVGLTINGAFHDLSLGDPGSWFGFVLPISLLIGVATATAYAAISDRYFPAVRRVHIDSGDLAGLEARVVSRSVSHSPRSGRAQRLDGGVLHVVHCHTAEEDIRFGCRVVLGQYDPSAASYRIARRRTSGP
jgi:hypothetical protein